MEKFEMTLSRVDKIKLDILKEHLRITETTDLMRYVMSMHFGKCDFCFEKFMDRMK